MSGLEKALHDLSWERVVQAVADRCTGPLRERLDELPLADRYEDAALALRETAEARRLIALADPLPRLADRRSTPPRASPSRPSSR